MNTSRKFHRAKMHIEGEVVEQGHKYAGFVSIFIVRLAITRFSRFVNDDISLKSMLDNIDKI